MQPRTQQDQPLIPLSVFSPKTKKAGESIKTLLSHIVHADIAQAEAMIKIDPTLLLHKGEVEDDAKRRIHGTPLQVALGAKDVNMVAISQDTSFGEIKPEIKNESMITLTRPSSSPESIQSHVDTLAGLHDHAQGYLQITQNSFATHLPPNHSQQQRHPFTM